MARDEYRLFLDDEIFIVRWYLPTVEAIDALGQDLVARHEAIGQPLFFAVLIPPDSPTPNKLTRERFMRSQSMTFDRTSTMRMVILPGSLRQSMLHKILMGMRMVSTMRGQTLFVDKGLAALGDAITHATGRDSASLWRGMIAAGVLSEDEVPAQSSSSSR